MSLSLSMLYIDIFSKYVYYIHIYSIVCVYVYVHIVIYICNCTYICIYKYTWRQGGVRKLRSVSETQAHSQHNTERARARLITSHVI